MADTAFLPRLAAALFAGALVLACSGGPAAQPPSETPGALQDAATAVAAQATPTPISTPTPAPAGPLAGRRICIAAGHDDYWNVGAT